MGAPTSIPSSVSPREAAIAASESYVLPRRSRTAVLVVGVHRSGTSMLAGILARLGCDVALNQMPANFANEKGYQESLAIAQFNDRLLKSASVRWNDFEKVPEGWFASPHAEHARDEAASLIEQEFGASPFFVLKDPRICRLMPFWRTVFDECGIDLVVVHIHRSPLEVAASLAARDDTPEAYGRAIWLRNFLEGERGSRGLLRTFTSYNSVLGNWGRETKRIAQTLGLTWPRLTTGAAVEIGDFVTFGLRHFRTAPEQIIDDPMLPDWVRESFTVAEAWAQHGEDTAGRDVLDRVLAEFDAGVAAFGSLVMSGQADRAALGAAETRATEIEAARATEAETHVAAIKEHEVVRQRLESERDDALAWASDAERAAANWTAAARVAEEELASTRADAARSLRESRAAEAELAARLERREAEFAGDRAAAEAREAGLADAFRAEAARLEADRDARVARLSEAARADEEALERQRVLARELLAERDALAEERDALAHDCSALMTSTSWRLTAPLRWLRETLRLR